MAENEHIMPRAPDLEKYIHDGNRRRFITYHQGQVMYGKASNAYMELVKEIMRKVD